MIDFEPWDRLLRQYVDQEGCVDYVAWKKEQPQAIADWLSSERNLVFKSNSNNLEQLALWINLYNAFTISTILERYPIESIRPRILGIPNWLAFFVVLPTSRLLYLWGKL